MDFIGLRKYLFAFVAILSISILISLVLWHGAQIENIKAEAFADGQGACRKAVEDATTRAMEDAARKLVEQEIEFNRKLVDAQETAKRAIERQENLRVIAKGQHEELNAQGADLQCTIPDTTIDILNKPIRIGAGASPPPVPKKEVGSPPLAPVVPATPPKGGDLPAFLRPSK